MRTSGEVFFFFLFPDQSCSDVKSHVRSFPTPQSPRLPVPLDLRLTGAVAVHAVHLEVSFAVAPDQRSGDERHDGDGQELSQGPPGEDVVQGGDV